MSAPSAALRRVALCGPAEVDQFFDLAARLIAAGRTPQTVVWRIAGETAATGDLFCGDEPAPLREASPIAAPPRAFAELARRALLHVDRGRHELCYRLLWRLRDTPRLMSIATDPDVARLDALARAVRRDMHKMTAFVRFRRVGANDGAEEFIAWFEPDHHIVAAAAPFFVRRFASMRWSILTPRACARWDGAQLTLGPGADRRNAPCGDALEDVWRAYYRAIFNPARLNLKAMVKEMPRKYWRNMPEADLIAPLTRQAEARARTMLAAAPSSPRRTSSYRAADSAAAGAAAEADDLESLAASINACAACDLCRYATQAVPGEGPAGAKLMFVGEQPGDEEDIQGRPFVGPAGKVFDAALERLEIDREKVFVTNAVKHFKFEPRGKKRIHKKPGAREIAACNAWLIREMQLVRPRLVVALGATAATALAGRATSLRAVRGQTLELPGGVAFRATVHPSYLLRLPDRDAKKAEWKLFLADLDAARRIAGL